jgi:hypothetical protein
LGAALAVLVAAAGIATFRLARTAGFIAGVRIAELYRYRNWLPDGAAFKYWSDERGNLMRVLAIQQCPNATAQVTRVNVVGFPLAAIALNRDGSG